MTNLQRVVVEENGEFGKFNVVTIVDNKHSYLPDKGCYDFILCIETLIDWSYFTS